MNALVVDLSVIEGWIVESPATAYAEGISQRIVAGAIPWISLLVVAEFVEFVRIREEERPTGWAEKILVQLAALPWNHAPAPEFGSWNELLTLAKVRGLMLSQAASLQLALDRGLPLSTCDPVLAQAARDEGVEVV